MGSELFEYIQPVKVVWRVGFGGLGVGGLASWDLAVAQTVLVCFGHVNKSLIPSLFSAHLTNPQNP
jgi:hypothetical protein